MKKILAVVIAAVVLAMAGLSFGSANAVGSDGPTPYTVNASGVTLPAGETFQANGHVNIKYVVDGDHAVKTKGIHFDPNNNQPGGAWIGKSNIPWSGFGLTGKFCVTWVQVAGYNEHFGEGGQQPVCVGDTPTTPPSADNKKVELCHATGSATNPYTKIEVSVSAFYNAGHIDHNNDIWNAFSYTTKDGRVVNVPSRGNTALLAFADCVQPPADTPVTKPDVVYNDDCYTKDDVFSMAPGNGYTVGNIVLNNDGTQSLTATLLDGFKWSDGSKTPYTITKPQFTNEDCDLPETGGKQVAGYVGVFALAALIGAGATFVFAGRRKSA